MTKEPNNECLTLSRYFRRNIDTIKNRNLTEDFEKSSYFCSTVIENKNVEKKKKAKRKILGPQCRGFTNAERKRSDTDKDQIDLIVAQIENSIKESSDFLGFSQEEILSSKTLCEKNISEVVNFEKSTFQVFRGFSENEQNETIAELSNILEKCVSIRSDIYKNIDRRILTFHLKEGKPREKVVCSKYWPKQENCTVKLEDVTGLKKNGMKTEYQGTHSFKIGRNLRKKNGVKMEPIKTEVRDMKHENNLIAEIHRLKQELKALRTNNSSPTKDKKPQDAPFIQVKKELVMSPFIPPKSPHNLIEEDLFHDPWSLLIATIFLNKTSGRTARPYIFWFLEENPDPLIVLGKRVEQLETYFGALGLQKTRASQVWRMSHDFIYKTWQKVSDLYGIGRYGEEAFRMFCLGDFSFVPKDRYLRIYKAWYEMQERNARLKEMNS